MEYPVQTIARLTRRLGRAPTPEEVKAERDMLMRAVYGSMLLAEISFADEVVRKQDGNCTLLSPVKVMGAPKRHLGPTEEDQLWLTVSVSARRAILGRRGNWGPIMVSVAATARQ
jgi:hypothetical protein